MTDTSIAPETLEPSAAPKKAASTKKSKSSAKALKKEKAAAAAPKKAAPKQGEAPATLRARAGAYAPEQKIKLLTKENPGREGTKRHGWFELYRTCKTVGAYLEAGGDRGYLKYDSAQGFIEIV